MKALLVVSAVLVIAGPALAQTGQRPADTPLSVKPVTSETQTTDAVVIRSKIERMGYTDVIDLSRDSMGVWRAKAKRGAEAVDVAVDKGGRIKTLQQETSVSRCLSAREIQALSSRAYPGGTSYVRQTVGKPG